MRTRPVLDPFEVAQQGEQILRQELTALATPRLQDIVIGYGFAKEEDAHTLARGELTTMILAGVRRPNAPKSADTDANT